MAGGREADLFYAPNGENFMIHQPKVVYQFKISLDGIKPTIWRRIQVPAEYSFWDLHVAIQDAMGWDDYHLHEFEMKDPETQETVRIGIPDDEIDWGRETVAGWDVKIPDYFTENNRLAKYLYDFGDGWLHRVRFEKAEISIPTRVYPVCLAGKQACPPEDVGGIWGYESFLNIIRDPTHEEYEEMLEWAGEEFDPNRFEPDKVKFCDPAERWNTAFNE
jgi:hypothetical protein